MPHPSTRLRRNRSIRNAISTSLVSKGSTAVLQFVSLPVAARILGREEFGIYATISLAVFMVALLQLGVGPALGRGLSEASAKGDRRREGQLFLNGAILVSALAFLGFLLAAVLITAVPVPVLFGAEYAPFAEKMRPALWIGVVLMLGLVLVELTDRVREGYMESHIVNAWAAAGNLAGAILVFAGIHFQPNISFLLVAVFGPNIVARALSTIFLLRKRPWLINQGFQADRKTMTGLIRDGLSFSATSFIVYVVEFGLCAVIIGHISGPADVAIFQILMAITTAFCGMLIMVGRPVWAATADAITRGDHSWMVSAAQRYYLYLWALAAAAGIGLITLGPWIVPKLYGAEFAVGRTVFIAHTLFLLAIGWRHVNRYLAIGLGLINRTVGPILIGLAAGMILGGFGLGTYGLAGLFIGLSLGTLSVPGLILPRLVWRKLNQHQDVVPAAPELLTETPPAAEPVSTS